MTPTRFPPAATWRCRAALRVVLENKRLAIVAAAPANAANLHRAHGVRRNNQAHNCAQRRAARNSQHVRIGQRIPQQTLEIPRPPSKARAHQNSQRDARQPKPKNHQPKIRRVLRSLCPSAPLKSVVTMSHGSTSDTRPSRNDTTNHKQHSRESGTHAEDSPWRQRPHGTHPVLASSWHEAPRSESRRSSVSAQCRADSETGRRRNSERFRMQLPRQLFDRSRPIPATAG